MSLTVAVDAASGDGGLAPAAAAIRAVLRRETDLDILAVGPAEELRALLGETERATIVDAPEVISMSEPPLQTLRKRASSMFRTIEAVAEGRAGAALSAGNTGALMGMGRTQLKVLSGCRPAIASFVPCDRCRESFCMLDLGASTDRTAELLVSHAHLGAALHRAIKGSTRPRIALLNIGEESIKGDAELRAAGEQLQASDLNFIGNVEADALYAHHADVAVCDGFTGNIFLKTMEGLSGMVKHMMVDAFNANAMAQFSGLVARPVLNNLKRVMDKRKYNGAAILGLNGLVVKSHGNADAVAFEAALDFTVRQLRHDLVAAMRRELERTDS